MPYRATRPIHHSLDSLPVIVRSEVAEPKVWRFECQVYPCSRLASLPSLRSAAGKLETPSVWCYLSDSVSWVQCYKDPCEEVRDGEVRKAKSELAACSLAARVMVWLTIAAADVADR